MQEAISSQFLNKLASVSPRTAKKIGLNILLALVYVLAGKFGLHFASLNESVSAIWPSTGIAIAAIILFGYEMWPGILLGALITNFSASGGFGSSLVIAFGNTFEALLGGYFINSYAFGRKVFETTKSTILFVVLAGILSTMVAATIGASALIFSNLAEAVQFKQIWMTWWLGDMAGALIITPFIILWATVPRKKLEFKQILELLLVVVVLVVTTELAFGGPFSILPSYYPVTFLIILPIVWSAVRFRRRETAGIMLLATALSIIGVVRHGFGDFIAADPNESLLLLQGFLIVTSLSSLVLSVTFSESTHFKDALLTREKYFRSLIEKNYDAIAAVDRRANILYASPSTEGIFGYAPGEVEGRSGFEFIHPEDREKVEKAILELVKNEGGVIRAETRIHHKNGEWLYVESVVTNLLNEPSVGAIVVNYRDITEKKAVENKKNEFIALISQQLRTPLGTIDKYTSSLIENKNKFSTIEQSYLKEILKASQSLEKMTENLVKMSRISLHTLKVDPQTIGVERVLETSLKGLKHKITSKEIKIERAFKTPKMEIATDLSLFSSLISTILVQVIGRTNIRNVLLIEMKKQSRKNVIKLTPNAFLKEKRKTPRVTSGVRGEERNKEEAEFFVAKALAAYMGIEIIDNTKKPDRSITLVLN